MGFLSLLVVASMPIMQFLLIGLLGAFLASGYSNILTDNARKHINKIAFTVFSPSMVFSNLAKTVTLGGLISWWYMPINVAITFLIGEFLGWIAVKILRPGRHLEPLVIASCSAGNLGSLLLIIVPAICNEPNSPFGETSICRAQGLSYVALSMSIGNLFIWTRTYSQMKKSCALYSEIGNEDIKSEVISKDAVVNDGAHLIKILGERSSDQQETIPLLSNSKLSDNKVSFWEKVKGFLHKTAEQILEILEPPTVAAIIGLTFGVIPWLKSLVVGDNASLRVVQDSLILLGDGLLPCVVLILGGNLIQGLRKATVRPLVIIAVIFVRYVMLPLCGIATVKVADKLGFLPEDPLYHYVLLLQFALPPALSISTMTQLFNVGKEECSVVLLWNYLAAALALTAWSTVFLWILA